MTKRDMIDDLVDIVCPWPDRPDADAGEDERDGFDALCADVEERRRALEENMRIAEEAADHYYDYDPLLDQLRQTTREIRELEARRRALLAYGREFVLRQYRLQSLADAAGMSVSGARTAYDDNVCSAVARRIGRPRRPRAAAAAQPGDPSTEHTS